MQVKPYVSLVAGGDSGKYSTIIFDNIVPLGKMEYRMSVI